MPDAPRPLRANMAQASDGSRVRDVLITQVSGLDEIEHKLIVRPQVRSGLLEDLLCALVVDGLDTDDNWSTSPKQRWFL